MMNLEQVDMVQSIGHLPLLAAKQIHSLSGMVDTLVDLFCPESFRTHSGSSEQVKQTIYAHNNISFEVLQSEMT